MKLLIKIALIIVITFNGSPAQEIINVSLEECVRSAIENNHAYKKAILDKMKAEEKVNESFGTAVLPKIDGSLNYTNAIKRGVFKIDAPGFSGTFPIGSKHSFTAGVTIEQPLLTGAMFLASEIAGMYAEIMEKAADYSKDELVLKVRQAYYTYLLADSFVKLADFQIKRADENRKNTDVMYKAGLIAEYDYIRANVTYQNLLPEKTGALNQKKQAMNNLKLLMGINLSDSIMITDSLTFKEIPLPDYVTGKDSMLEKNHLIQQLELDTKFRDLRADYEWSKHFPELQGFGNWQVQALEEKFIPKDWDYFNSINVGLALRIPIFYGFAVNSRVEQAKIDLKISKENLINTRETIKNNYDNVILQIKKSYEQIDAYKASMDEAERGYQIALKRFNTGLGTQLEVTDALGALLTAQVNYLQSVYDYRVSHATLDMLMGKSIDEIEFN